MANLPAPDNSGPPHYTEPPIAEWNKEVVFKRWRAVLQHIADVPYASDRQTVHSGNCMEEFRRLNNRLLVLCDTARKALAYTGEE